MKYWLKRLVLIALVPFVPAFMYLLPLHNLFDKPYCTVLTDRNGELLNARIAADEQWRFPPSDSVPYRFEQCILAFEDRYFYAHPGVRIESIARATVQNISEKRVVSGASTLTMQTIRLARDGQTRSIWEKLMEMVLAVSLELITDKEEILGMYCSHAPFGGNVVGLEAASWRYYNRPSQLLTWAESATLAVLPNAPSLIFPGKRSDALLAKRNRVLAYLVQDGTIDSLTYELALSEPIPYGVYPIPNKAPHLLAKFEQDYGKGARYKSTISSNTQQLVSHVLQSHQARLTANEVYNAAVIVLDVDAGYADAYVGNLRSDSNSHGEFNDLVQTPRSTGSVLKPLLFAHAMDDGLITQKSLLPDIPSNYGGYSPKNYTKEFLGAVPADEALALSLNVPAVRLLRDYGTHKFHHELNQAGFSTFNRSADAYGLTLILGGGECTLWELVSVYRNWAYQLKNYPEMDKWIESSVIMNSTKKATETHLSSGVIYATLTAMLEVTRPEEEQLWEYFEQADRIAWKTGTSFGNRDAWAVGVSANKIVAVWVGNADGEGRPGITGIHAAAPILFNVFDVLGTQEWFYPPYDDMIETALCAQSGNKAGRYCQHVTKTWIPLSTEVSKSCSYCQRVFVDESHQYRVNRQCYSQPQADTFFVLTPRMEWYYKQKHPSYQRLPNLHPNCIENALEYPLRILYPEPSSSILIPRDLDGLFQKVVFEASHRQEETTLYWHLDGMYIGSTTNFHQLEYQPTNGEHVLSIIDENGFEFSSSFVVK